MSFQNYQQQQFEGGQFNALTSQKKYTILTFKLDKATSLSDSTWRMNFPIRSFWVRKASPDFEASIKLNYQNDEGDALPLSRNMNLGYDFPQAGVAFQWPAQAGKEMQIVFAHDSIIDVGLVENELNAEFSLKRYSLGDVQKIKVGDNYVTITSPVQILNFDDQRDHALITNFDDTIYGRDTLPIALFLSSSDSLLKPFLVLKAGQSLVWEYNTPLFACAWSDSFNTYDQHIFVREVMK